MDHQWLNKLFEQNADKNQSELARYLGYDPAVITRMMAGKRQLKAHEIPKIRQFFGLPRDNDTGVQALTSECVIPVIDPEFGERWVLPKKALKDQTSDPKGLEIMILRDSAMSPLLIAGNYLLIDKNSKNLDDSGIFVIETGSRRLVRRCEPVIASTPPSVRLITADTTPPQIVERDKVTVIGRVIARTEFF
ncbi:MAG: helix-turn-helix transcriptional regulator [Micavibrio sp.]